MSSPLGYKSVLTIVFPMPGTGSGAQQPLNKSELLFWGPGGGVFRDQAMGPDQVRHHQDPAIAL